MALDEFKEGIDKFTHEDLLAMFQKKDETLMNYLNTLKIKWDLTDGDTSSAFQVYEPNEYGICLPQKIELNEFFKERLLYIICECNLMECFEDATSGSLRLYHYVPDCFNSMSNLFLKKLGILFFGQISANGEFWNEFEMKGTLDPDPIFEYIFGDPKSMKCIRL